MRDTYNIWFQKKHQHKGTNRKPELKCKNKVIVEKLISGIRSVKRKNGRPMYIATWGKSNY